LGSSISVKHVLGLDASPGVRLDVEEWLDVPDIHVLASLQVLHGKLVEIVFVQKNFATGKISFEESRDILATALFWTVVISDVVRLDKLLKCVVFLITPTQGYMVALCKLPSQGRLQGALDVDVKLDLWEVGDEWGNGEIIHGAKAAARVPKWVDEDQVSLLRTGDSLKAS
jgi:hypothetical protein